MSAYEVTLRRSGDTFVLGSVATRGRQGESGGGGGDVSSVNGQTGVVVLDYSDVGADEEGAAADVAATAAAGDLAVAAAASAALASHASDTTAVHGIADTAALATGADITSAVSAHAAASDPHGDRAYAAALVDDLSGVSSPATARSNLGLVIGTDVQAQNANLALFAALIGAADRIPYFTGTGAMSLATFTSFGRTLAALADAAAGRTALGLVPGTDVQAYHANLAAIAGLTSAANKFAYFTGSGTAALADLTAFARTLIDDADAKAARATIGAAGKADGILKCATGLWVHAPTIPTETNPTSGRVYYHPIWLEEDTPVDRIAAYHNSTTGGGGSTLELGVYANDPATDRPAARYFTAGTISLATAAAFKSITISQTLAAGRWWLGSCYVATSAPRLYCHGTTTSQGGMVVPIDSATYPTSYGNTLYESGTSLPSTATPAAGAHVTGPMVFLRRA